MSNFFVGKKCYSEIIWPLEASSPFDALHTFAKFDFSKSIFQRLFDLLNEKEAEGEALNPHDLSIYLWTMHVIRQAHAAP